MKNTAVKNSSSVIVFPSALESVANKEVSFLLSAQQIEEITDIKDIWPIPFSPTYVEGISQWRSSVLPVFSIERCLGFELSENKFSGHALVVLSPAQDMSNTKFIRGMVRIVTGIRNLTLPIEASPVSINGWIPKTKFVRGVYEWHEGYIVVVDLTKILNGQINDL